MPNWKKVILSGSSAKLANETFISGHITASGIVKAEHLFSTDDAEITDDLVVGGNIDLEGNIDVNGTANLDVVDIDGAVDMASTLAIGGNTLINAQLAVNSSTINASNKLEVHGQARVNGTMMIGDSSISNTTSTGQLHIKNTGTATIRLEDSDNSNLAFDILVNEGTGFQIKETVGGDSGDNVRLTIAETTGVATFSGEVEAASLDISGDADIDGTLEADAITVNGTALNTVIAGVTVTNSTNAAHVLITDNESTNEHNQITFIEGAAGGTANRGLEADGHLTYNPSKGLVIAPNFSASGHIHAVGDITSSAIIKAEHLHSTDDAQIDDDLTVGGDIDLEGSIDVNGTANLDVVDIDGAVNIAATTTVATDNKLSFRDAAIYIASSTDGQLDIVADTEIQIAATTIDINGAINASGEIIAASLDISGNADIDGTLEADAITVNGTALNTVIAGVTVTNSTNAAHVLITDNESTNEENQITFIEGAGGGTANRGLEADGNLTYNPSSGTVTATVFKGNIDAVDGDFDGTLEADAITVGGTALNTVIAGVTVTNSTNAAHVLITDNESTNEHNQITFIEGAAGGTANRGLEADGHLTYNPSKGLVIAPNFSASGEIHAAGNITASGTGSFVGGVDLLDNNYLNIGTGDDLRLYHNATDTFIDNETGHLNIRNLADDKDIIFGCDDGSGGVETYFFLDGSAGSDKPITTFPDNSKLRFGSGGDLVLLHDATDSKITNNVGDLIIDSAANDKDIIFKGTDGGADITALTLDMSAAGKATFNNTVVIPSLQFKISSTTHGNSGGGDVVYFGSTTSMTAGQIYYYNASGNWALTDADAVATADGMIGVALGAASDTNGVMLRGMTTLDHDPGTVGDPLFLSTTAGKATSTAPSGNGDIVRVIGYCLGSINGEIYFNPSGTFVEVTA